MTIYDAAMAYARTETPLIVIAGKEYGTGSSRDWAAKGTRLLGVRAVIAESFERIHRSNLVGMGVLPLEFADGATRQSLGLTGFETYEIDGLTAALAPRSRLTVHARDGARDVSFAAVLRIDTPEEMAYYRHGGILPYVLRQLVGRKRSALTCIKRRGRFQTAPAALGGGPRDLRARDWDQRRVAEHSRDFFGLVDDCAAAAAAFAFAAAFR